jgi:hypothetical protein
MNSKRETHTQALVPLQSMTEAEAALWAAGVPVVDAGLRRNRALDRPLTACACGASGRRKGPERPLKLLGSAGPDLAGYEVVRRPRDISDGRVLELYPAPGNVRYRAARGKG